MKIPFCDFCAKSGSLCQKCKEIIDSGKNDTLDLTVSKILLEEASRIRELDKVEFRKAYREGDSLLILSNSDGVKLLRNSEEFAKRVRSDIESEKIIVVDYKKDQKRKLEELVYPFRIIGLSKIWLPGNMTEFKLLVEGGRGMDKKRFQLLENLAKRIGISVRIQAS